MENFVVVIVVVFLKMIVNFFDLLIVELRFVFMGVVGIDYSFLVGVEIFEEDFEEDFEVVFEEDFEEVFEVIFEVVFEVDFEEVFEEVFDVVVVIVVVIEGLKVVKF